MKSYFIPAMLERKGCESMHKVGVGVIKTEVADNEKQDYADDLMEIRKIPNVGCHWRWHMLIIGEEQE